MLERQHRLDEPREARHRVEVTDVGLHRADGDRGAPLRPEPIGAHERRHLDRIPERRGRAVGLHVTDVRRLEVRVRQRLLDDGRLPLHARGRVARLQIPIIVDGRALDDRPDRVAIAHRIRQTLQHHRRHAIAAHRALGPRVERATMPIRREDHPLLVDVARALRHDDARGPGQRHVGLLEEKALAGHVDRHQPRRARRVDEQALAREPELVGDPRGQRPVRRRGAHLEVDRRVERHALQHRLRVARVRGPRVQGDAPLEALRIAARVLQRCPDALEKPPLLRIHPLRLAQGQAKELVIEPVDVREHPSRGHEPRVLRERHALGETGRGFDLVGREAGDGLLALAQLAPERCYRAGSRELAGHTDDRDVTGPELHRLVLSHARRSLSLSTPAVSGTRHETTLSRQKHPGRTSTLCLLIRRLTDPFPPPQQPCTGGPKSAPSLPGRK